MGDKRSWDWIDNRATILRDWHENRVSYALTLKRLMKLGMSTEKALESMKAS